MTTDVPSLSPARSTFVTVVAWVFIVLSGFATPISVLQNVMVFLVMRPMTHRLITTPETGEKLPTLVKFMFDYMHLFFLAFLVVSVTTLVASIGVLKRRNWARVVFLGLMALGVLYQVAGLAFQWVFMSKIPNPSASAPEFRTVWLVMTGVTLVLAVGLCALFVWIARKLSSDTIAREFS